MQFVNKVVVITGAASGIGAKTAELFASEGASLAIIDINEEGLKNVAERCKKNGNKTHQVVANLKDDEAIKKIIEEVVDQFGKIDILVNCAGSFKGGIILDGSVLETFDEVLNVNLRAIVHLTTLAAPHLIKSKGSIINISSVLALYNSKSYAYSLSKVGIEKFTRGSALELSPFGVRVNAVRPGPVKTKILENSGFEPDYDRWKTWTTLNRLSEPEEIADLILFLASDKARGITGSVFTCDNGMLLKNA